MLIDFTNTSGEVFFNGLLINYNSYRLILTSRYSNKRLVINKKDYLNVTVNNRFDKWYSLIYEVLEEQRELDIGGYYDVEVWGSNDEVNYTLIQKELGKLINNFTQGITREYVSDNESNEEEIYYRR